MKDQGTEHLLGAELARRASGFELHDNAENLAGLQLAELVVILIGRRSTCHFPSSAPQKPSQRAVVAETLSHDGIRTALYCTEARDKLICEAKELTKALRAAVPTLADRRAGRTAYRYLQELRESQKTSTGQWGLKPLVIWVLAPGYCHSLPLNVTLSLPSLALETLLDVPAVDFSDRYKAVELAAGAVAANLADG